MSVLPCSRQECSNIMCDRHSSKHGYICNECFDELVALGYDTDIEAFMNSHPVRVRADISFNKWSSEFPDREDV